MARQFNKFNSRGTFICMTCEHRTRDTGQGVDHLCEFCFELAGLDNQVNDDGVNIAEDVKLSELRDHFLKKIEKRGGNVAKVKAANEYLWPTEEA